MPKSLYIAIQMLLLWRAYETTVILGASLVLARSEPYSLAGIRLPACGLMSVKLVWRPCDGALVSGPSFLIAVTPGQKPTVT